MATGTLHPYGARLMLTNTFLTNRPMKANMYLALTKYPPSMSSDASNLDEPESDAEEPPSYERVSVGIGDTNWGIIDDHRVVNTNAITFPQPTTLWGYISGWALVSHQRMVEGGDLIASGSFTVGAYLTETSPAVRVPPGGLQIVIFG